MENIEKNLKLDNLQEKNKDKNNEMQLLNEIRRRYEEIMKKEKEGEFINLEERWPAHKLKYNFGESFELKASSKPQWHTDTSLGKKTLFYPVKAISLPDNISEEEKERRREIIDGGVVHEAGHHLGAVKVLENFILEKDTKNKLFNQFKMNNVSVRDRKNIERQLRAGGQSFIEQNIDIGPYIGNILFLKDLHNIVLDIWLESYEKQLPDSTFARKVKRGLDSLNEDLFPETPPETIRFDKLKLDETQFRARFKNDHDLKTYLFNNLPQDVKDDITEEQISAFILDIENQLNEEGEIILKKSRLLSSQLKSALMLAAMRPDWEDWQGEEFALWEKEDWVDPRVANSLKNIKEQESFKNLLTVDGFDEAFTPREVIKWVQKNKIKKSYNQIRAEFLRLFDIDFKNKVDEVASQYNIKTNKYLLNKDGGDETFTSQDANDLLTDLLIKGLKESQDNQDNKQGAESNQEGEQGEQGQGQGQGEQGEGEEGEGEGEEGEGEEGEQGQGEQEEGEQREEGGQGQGGEDTNFEDLPQDIQRDILNNLLDQMEQESVGRESLSEENQNLSDDIENQARNSIPSAQPEKDSNDEDENEGENNNDSNGDAEDEIDERENKITRKINRNQRMVQRHEGSEMKKAELLDLSLEEYRDYKESKERLYGQIKVLSDKLTEIMVANKEMRTKKRLPYGRLSTGELGGFIRAVSSGYEPDSFELPKLAEKPMNVDIMFLVDHSGSMSGEPIQAAADSALIWAEAIRRAENNIEKKVSTSRQDRESLRMGLMTFANQPVLWDDLKDELTDKDIAKIYTKAKDLEGGFTADSSAIRELLNYLNKEQKRKKRKTLQIMVVLTDGQGEYDKVKKVIDDNMRNKASILVALGMGDGTEDVLETYNSTKYKNKVIAKSISDEDIPNTGAISAHILIKPIKEILLGK